MSAPPHARSELPSPRDPSERRSLRRRRNPRAQRLLAIVFALSGATATIASSFACNAIIGVEDVKLARDRDGSALGRDDDTSSPDPDQEGGTPNRPNVFQVVLGEAHSCARVPSGTVRCWGSDALGQTGSGGAADGGAASTPLRAIGVDDAVDVAAGSKHTCVARLDGTASCWGDNGKGQLGDGLIGGSESTPVTVIDLDDAVAVAAGGDFSCAIRADASVVCWGANDSGQLGNGSQSASASPVPVADLANVVAIAAGQAHACAIDDEGGVHCWGAGKSGQLGAGTVGSKTKPVTVDSLPPARIVAAAQRSTCALTEAGSVYCWGANDLGQLGTGATNDTPNPSPIIVTNLGDATGLWTGRNHACASRKTGAVVCWGDGSRGQLGDGQARTDAGAAQPSYVLVAGVTTAVGVAAGGDHSCALTRTSAILCWGANDRGQLGDGSLKSELSPVSVEGYP
jgi:alpha-tubulin suppressor-like RCC1 family protein